MSEKSSSYKTLREVLEENEISLISSGKRWVAVCPFHEGDRDPSFTLYEETDTYYCFGCSAWGDAIKFLVDYKGLSYKDAAEYVGADYKSRVKKTQVIKITRTVDTWKLLADVTDQYHEFLLGMPGALDYLQRRGLSMETIKRYRLGYTDGRVLNLQWAEDVALAQEIGLLSTKNREMLSHRITIPNLLGESEADFMIGRSVVNDKVKYLGIRMPKPVFGFYEVRHSPVLFLAEGQFDWLALRQWGYPAVVLGGTHLPRYHENLLVDKTLVIVPDQDRVGINAANGLKDRFDKAYILDMGQLGVKDVGELAAVENGKELFDSLVKEQLAWFNILLSKTTLKKWLPNLASTTPLLST